MQTSYPGNPAEDGIRAARQENRARTTDVLPASDVNRDRALGEIAREKLGIETLELRGRDRLDFHDVGVANLKKALLAAYEAGRSSTLGASILT